MRWRVGKNSIVGIKNVDLPQFSLVDFDTLSTIQVLASGKLLVKDKTLLGMSTTVSLCNINLGFLERLGQFHKMLISFSYS